jgi:hypothetical protein
MTNVSLQTEMPSNGSYSFKTGKTRNIELENGMKIRIKWGNTLFARLDFVDDADNIVPAPNGITLMDLDINDEYKSTPNYPFIIIWTQSYALRLNGHDLMKIINQKESVIFGGSEFSQVEQARVQVL